jgi:hypothetical protein
LQTVVNTKVKTITIERVCGRELPPEWAKKAGVAPDDRVQVIIGPSREQAAEELMALVDRMGKEAQEKGLGEETLDALLRNE